jgi:hypothetical protein
MNCPRNSMWPYGRRQELNFSAAAETSTVLITDVPNMKIENEDS